MVILMSLALSHKKILHYQQIKKHFVLIPIESMKLVQNLYCILDQCIYQYLCSLIHMTLIFFFSSILLSYYVYIFNNYIVISGFIANEINKNNIFNVRKMMTLVMSVMILKQKHIKINDTKISVTIKILD